MFRLIFLILLITTIGIECRNAEELGIRPDNEDSWHISRQLRQATDDKIVVCYCTNWSVYRHGIGKFLIENIDPFLCTHLIYAFGALNNEDGLKPSDTYQDIDQGGYTRFTDLKLRNKNLKTMISVGGWNEASNKFSSLAADQNKRGVFVQNVIKFLRQNNFDGLDIDWQYRAKRTQADKENYPLMVKELKEAFDREPLTSGKPQLLLTMTVPVMVEKIDNGYDLPSLSRYLDFMNILNYDYHSSFEPYANHHSPLYYQQNRSEYQYDPRLNVDFTIKYCLEKGAEPKKLIVGIPTYGRSFTLKNARNIALGSPTTGPGKRGEGSGEDGFLAYYEICSNIKTKNWKKLQQKEGIMGPVAHLGNQWIGYDDEDSVRLKAMYVKEKGLGGIMFWSVDMDDFNGICGNGIFPLINSGKEVFFGKTGNADTAIARSKRSPLHIAQPLPLRSSHVRTGIADFDKHMRSIRSQNQGTITHACDPHPPLMRGTAAHDTNAEPKKIVCYYASWSSNRLKYGNFSPTKISPFLCTHLMYAFGSLDRERGLKPSDQVRDIDQGGYTKFTGLKAFNKNLKTMLSVGGWNEASYKFSNITADKERRTIFVQNVLKFLRQNNFDGLDIDWQFREKRTQTDRENYPAMLRELREEFDRDSARTRRPRLLLSMTMPVVQEKIDSGYDIPNLSRYLDFINLLTYDYHSSFEPVANHHSPLYYHQRTGEFQYDPKLCADYTIKYILQKGADPKKLVMGIPLYGRSYTLTDVGNVNLGSPAEGPGDAGDTIDSAEKGFLPYYEICQNIKSGGWNVVNYKRSAMGPHAVRRNQWIGYDDLDSVKLKAKYVIEKGLGGTMFWSMDMDDFLGTCHSKPFPLITAAKETFESTTELEPQPVSPTKNELPNESQNPGAGESEPNFTNINKSKPPASPTNTNPGNNPFSGSETSTDNLLFALNLNRNPNLNEANDTKSQVIGKIFFLAPPSKQPTKILFVKNSEIRLAEITKTSNETKTVISLIKDEKGYESQNKNTSSVVDKLFFLTPINLDIRLY